MVTEEEAKDARTILVYFFGEQAKNWRINDQVLELIGKMLTSDRRCSLAMDFVPRPGFPVDLGYIKSQLKGIAKRLLGNKHSYMICKLFVARNFESAIRIAGLN